MFAQRLDECLDGFQAAPVRAAARPGNGAAAGKTAIIPDTLVNVNMNTACKPEGGLWGRNHKDYGKRWLHSDMKDMAFFYTHKLYKELVELGGL